MSLLKLLLFLAAGVPAVCETKYHNNFERNVNFTEHMCPEEEIVFEKESMSVMLCLGQCAMYGSCQGVIYYGRTCVGVVSDTPTSTAVPIPGAKSYNKITHVASPESTPTAAAVSTPSQTASPTTSTTSTSTETSTETTTTELPVVATTVELTTTATTGTGFTATASTAESPTTILSSSPPATTGLPTPATTVELPASPSMTPSTSQLPTTPSMTPSTSQSPTTPSMTPSTSQSPTTPSMTPSTSQLPTTPSMTPSTSQLPTTPSMTPATLQLPTTPSTSPSSTTASVCSTPLVANLDDAWFSSSPFFPQDAPYMAKLSIVDAHWSAKRNDPGQYIQVDLGTSKVITQVITRGACCGFDEFVRNYTVATSQDTDCTGALSPVTEYGSEDPKVFEGNSDWSSNVTNTFDPPLTARCFRIKPVDYYWHTSLQFELLGCDIAEG